MLKKCTYNSQYIAYYAQDEPTIILMLIKTNNYETCKQEKDVVIMDND